MIQVCVDSRETGADVIDHLENLGAKATVKTVKACYQCIWFEEGYPCGSTPTSELGCERFRRYNGKRVPDMDLI